MPDKNLIASYVATESERLNKAIKEMIEGGRMPTDEEKDALLSDMEATLAKLTSALQGLGADMGAMLDKEKEKEEPVA